MKRSKFSLLCTMLLSVLTLRAADSVYVSDPDFPFILISNDTVNQPPHISDEDFYALSTGVVFEVNKTEIRRDDQFLQLYLDSVLPRINSQHLQLRKIFIRGAASPEGPYANNQRLGRKRTEALLQLLQSSLLHQYIEADTELSSVTEDYGYLCLLMHQAGDKDYALVRSIYDECQGDELCCKQKLMAAQRGQLWKRLLRQYFPRLRSARLIMWFSRPDAKHAPIEPMPSIPVVTEDVISVSAPAVIEDVEVPTQTIEVLEEPLLPRRHMIAIRTNLLHDFFYMPQFGWAFSPNLQLEYYPLRGHYTFNAGVTWGTNRRWKTQEFFQVRDIQLEVRRYFQGGGKFMGTYLGAYAHGNKYGIGLSPTKGWQGEGGGAGITLGYVTKLNRRGNLRLEAMVAAGFYMSLYDPYVYGNPITGNIDGYYYYDYLGGASNFKKRNHRFTWFGPTNAGIQLTYDIIYRKRPKQ